MLTAMPPGRPSATRPRVGEDGEAAEDKTEERRHRPADHSERKGNGAERPYTHDDRKS